MVHKDVEQEFVKGMKAHLENVFGKNAKESPHFGRIINANHVNRINGLLSETKGETVLGGKEGVDPDSHYFPPTLVRNAQLGEPLLKEEIFGPVLPIVTSDSIEDAVNKVNAVL